MQVDFPFHFDARERTAEADEVHHVRDLIEQVLFTAPGERVNRPEFGAGVNRLVFSPASPEAAATAGFVIRAALQQTLGSRISVEDVVASAQDSTLRLTITYRLVRTGALATAEFTAGGAP